MNVKLLVVQGKPQGKSLLFPRGEYVFGRGAECHIRPNSDWVSRQHCLLRVTEGAVSIRDLSSRNGTLINGSRLIGEQPLADGDKLQVGPLVFQVQLDRPTAGDVTAVSKKPKMNDTLRNYIDTKEMVRLDGTTPAPALDESSPSATSNPPSR